jgi:hypothetical protein
MIWLLPHPLHPPGSKLNRRHTESGEKFFNIFIVIVIFLLLKSDFKKKDRERETSLMTGEGEKGGGGRGAILLYHKKAFSSINNSILSGSSHFSLLVNIVQNFVL